MDIKQIELSLTKELKESTIFVNEPMKKHTSFKVGGIADIYIKAKSIEDIKSVVNYAKENEIPLTVIGNGSNILVRDKGIRGIVLEIGLNNQEIKNQDDFAIITVRSRC